MRITAPRDHLVRASHADLVAASTARPRAKAAGTLPGLVEESDP